jgi:hypothetical protein
MIVMQFEDKGDPNMRKNLKASMRDGAGERNRIAPPPVAPDGTCTISVTYVPHRAVPT